MAKEYESFSTYIKDLKSSSYILSTLHNKQYNAYNSIKLPN